MNISYFFENSPVHISITANSKEEIGVIIDRFLDCAYLAVKTDTKNDVNHDTKRDRDLSNMGNIGKP